MENKINSVQAGIWGGFFLLLAITLLVNFIQSLFGQAEFAYWHMFTLLIAWAMFRASLTDIQFCRIIIHCKHALMAVASFFSEVPSQARKIKRAAASAAKALSLLPEFFVRNYNHFQTEP